MSRSDRPKPTPEQREAARSKRRQLAERRAARQQKAWQLHLAGVGYGQIAKQLGIGKTQAFRDVKNVLAELHKTRHEDADLERAKSLARIERMVQAVFSDAIKGDVKAVAEVRKLEDQRIRLLGLAAPVKAEVTGEVTVTAGVVVVPAVAGSVEAWRASQAQPAAEVVELRKLDGGDHG